MNERPANLGISFGFEPDLDNNVMISARLDSSSSCSSDSGRGTDSDIIVHTVIDKGTSNSSTVVQSAVTNSLDSRTPNAPGVIIMDSNRAGDNNNLSFNLTSSQLLNNQCQNQFVFIGPEQPDFPNPVTFTPEELHKFKVVAPPNGIIASQRTYILPTPPSQDLTVTNNKINTTHQCTDNKTEDNNPAESIPQSSTEPDTIEQPSKPITYDRSKDPNFQPGNFNHEAGVAFLYAGK
jgi:hypothetical protein